MTQADGDFSTVIGPDALFKGELTFEKGVRVLGQFEGEISTKGQLHVAEGAKLKADVTAGTIQVDGQIKGNLTATGKVRLMGSAKLEGDLRTTRLEVVEGAVFIGHCVVGQQAVKESGPQSQGARAPAAPVTEKPKAVPEPAKK
jgi:cytoskeletal protein CcmA (bactofilin family)